MMRRFVQGFFLLFTIIVLGCESPPGESKVKCLTLSLDVERQNAPDVSLDSREVPAFEHHGAWTEQAMEFMERWTSGKSLKVEQPDLAWRRYRHIMPCLWQGALPAWLDHEKAFKPTFGNYVGLLSSTVKEIAKESVDGGPRYYLETRCQWKHATALVRFTFKTDEEDKPVISGFWLAQDPEGPALPPFRSNGYIFGQEMMRLAGYADRDQLLGWRVKGGGWWTAPGGSSNHLLPIRVNMAGPDNHLSMWRVKLWYDPTTSSFKTRGQTTVINGKRWTRYYDPSPDRQGPPLTFEAVPGDYRISIEMPQKYLIPQNPSAELWEKAKPVADSFTVFSDVISIDDSIRSVDVNVSVSDVVMRQREALSQKVAERSIQLQNQYALEK